MTTKPCVSRTSGHRLNRPEGLPSGPRPTRAGARQKRGESSRSPRHSPARPPAAKEVGVAEARVYHAPNQGSPRRAAQASTVSGTQNPTRTSPRLTASQSLPLQHSGRIRRWAADLQG
ncbi:hypothetical protein NDU88_006289 [Pleurodeles waltl]|uniref:Uncharacterized protein n=1 Tax=Pleurodeles waltl TaxID=8319 RepID=A0AAV7X0C1_PLEWA|nr:hypothetical protein NDU88_006289 [Pleurodeles waltl]